MVGFEILFLVVYVVCEDVVFVDFVGFGEVGV